MCIFINKHGADNRKHGRCHKIGVRIIHSNIEKLKVCSHIARYPVLWTVQNTLHDCGHISHRTLW